MGKVWGFFVPLIGLQISFLFSISQSLARTDFIPGSRYTAARAAAMGDAYLPIGEDVASGLFYNPANLGKIRKTLVEPLNFSAYANTNYFGVINSNFYNVVSLSSFAPNLQKTPGQMAGIGGAFLPNVGFPGVSFGLLLQSELAAQANTDGSYTYRSLYQVVPTLGKGFHFFKGILRLGYSLQWVNQAVGTITSSGGGIPLGYDQGLAQGSGFSHNVGLALTVPFSLLPSFNIVVRNIGRTHYSSYSILPLSKNSNGTPSTDPMTLDASFSIHPKLGHGTFWNFVFEGRDLTGQSGASMQARLAIGTELMVKGKFFLRAGWRGGYPSGGFGLKRVGAEMSLTYYTEEVGHQYLVQGDSRVMLQYQFRNF